DGCGEPQGLLYSPCGTMRGFVLPLPLPHGVGGCCRQLGFAMRSAFALGARPRFFCLAFHTTRLALCCCSTCVFCLLSQTLSEFAGFALGYDSVLGTPSCCPAKRASGKATGLLQERSRLRGDVHR